MNFEKELENLFVKYLKKELKTNLEISSNLYNLLEKEVLKFSKKEANRLKDEILFSASKYREDFQIIKPENIKGKKPNSKDKLQCAGI